MGSRTLGPFPQANVLHEVGSTVHGNVVTNRYASSPITGFRPAEGRRDQTLTCLECGAPIACRIASVTVTRRRRTGWLVLALLGPLLVPVTVANFSQGETAVPAGVIVAMLFGLAAATVWGVVSWWKEDGVTLVSPASDPGSGAARRTGWMGGPGSVSPRRGGARPSGPSTSWRR